MPDLTEFNRPFRPRYNSGWIALAVAVGIGVFGLIRFDMIVHVDYRLAKVVSIQQVLGSDMADRLVVVDLGTYQRAIRTSDRLLVLRDGEPACVALRQFALRRWTLHTLALAGYCRRSLPQALVPSVGAP